MRLRCDLPSSPRGLSSQKGSKPDHYEQIVTQTSSGTASASVELPVACLLHVPGAELPQQWREMQEQEGCSRLAEGCWGPSNSGGGDAGDPDTDTEALKGIQHTQEQALDDLRRRGAVGVVVDHDFMQLIAAAVDNE